MTQNRPGPPPEDGDAVEQSVKVVVDFHLDHRKQSTPVQRAIDQLTDWIGRPLLVLALLGLALAWLITDVIQARGAAPTFTWLDLWATLTALFVSLLILATQRREDQLAERRAQLMLELALLADKKNAKIIALLEEMRRDSPTLASRPDPESERMTQPTDPLAVLQRIDERTEESGRS